MADLSCIPKFYLKELSDLLSEEDLYLMLLTSAHTPNPDLHKYISQVSVNEAVDYGGNYIAGGMVLSNLSSNYSGLNAFADADDVAIGPGSTIRYRWGVIYKKTATPGSSPIRAQVDFKEDQVITNGLSTIQWNTLGIIFYRNQ